MKATPLPKFYKGQKITYYGNPGEVKAVEFNPFSNEWTYNIRYTDKGQKRASRGCDDRDLKAI